MKVDKNNYSGSVLIIDDDKALSRTLHILMESQGYMVETALSAAEGMTRTTATLPSVTLVDLHLPDGNGLHLLHSMLQVNPTGKFILMSGDSDIAKLISESPNKGIDLLKKPFEIDDVLNRVAEKMMIC
ncbi:MAG: response regulator [Pseudomonadota bacterium]